MCVCMYTHADVQPHMHVCMGLHVYDLSLNFLAHRITKLGTLFDNSSEEGSTKKIDILAIEEQVNTLEHKVDNLLEQLIAQFNQSHA